MKAKTLPLRQKGFSLVELLVALVISLFLITGVLQIYVQSRQSYRVQENLSRLQENGRYAMDYVSRFVREAGFRANVGVSRATTFPAGSDVISGTDNTGTNSSDTITVRFESDGTMQDCLGATVAVNTLAVNTLSLSANNELQCNNGGGAQTIVEGVQNMQVLYGEDTDNDGVANRYTTVGSVNINNVVSIRVSLLLRTLEDNLATGTAQPYTFNGATVTPTDRRLRRVFTTTVSLRNRLP